MRPVPAEKVLELEEEWTSVGDIISSGPYFLDPKTDVETQTVLKRNPHWPLPFSGNVDVVHIVHLDSDEEAYQMWEGRELDLSPIPQIGQAAIVDNYRFKSQLMPRQTVFYLSYNFDSPVFGIPEIRRAFSWALDREQLITEVYDDQGLPARHFAPAGVFGAPPWDEVGIGYSPDRARQELDGSAYGHCSLLPDITYLVNSSDLALEQAEAMREMWIDELGCVKEQIIIEQVELGELLARTQPGAADRPDMWDLGWASYYPDEQNWVADQLHCQDSENRQKRPCGLVDEKIREANVTASTDERWRLYREIEGLFFSEGAIAPIAPLLIRADFFLRHVWLTTTPVRFGGEHYDTYLLDWDLKELERGG
jgi:oligopeptide transport system substrate-binding protein